MCVEIVLSKDLALTSLGKPISLIKAIHNLRILKNVIVNLATMCCVRKSNPPTIFVRYIHECIYIPPYAFTKFHPPTRTPESS